MAAIRRAESGEDAALAACIAAAYAPWVARLPDLPDVTGGLAEEIAAGHAWVAETGGRILGVMILVAGDGHLKLANLAVHPEAQGQGLARALLDRAEAAARGAGLTAIRLATHARMTGNLTLYRHLGWEETGRRGNTVLMTRTLS